MLKQRILTASILIPLVLWAIYRFSTENFMLATLLFTLVAAWEWARLSGQRLIIVRIVYCILLSALVYTNFLGIPIILSYLAPLWWIAAFAGLFYFNKHQKNLVNSSFLLSGIGLMVLISAWLNLNTLRYVEPFPVILLFFFVLIWGADIAAYFTGRHFGQHKLAPAISPNKTWEGVAGALFGTVILALGFAIMLQLSPIKALYLLLLSLLTTAFSIVGDLFESILKRTQGLKDSGSLFPGHGGMLDRIDSIIAAAPIFTLGYVHQDHIIRYLTSLI